MGQYGTVPYLETADLQRENLNFRTAWDAMEQRLW